MVVNQQIQFHIKAIRNVLTNQLPAQMNAGTVDPASWRGLHEAADWLADNHYSLTPEQAETFRGLLVWLQTTVNAFLDFMRKAISEGLTEDEEMLGEMRSRIETMWAGYDERARRLYDISKDGDVNTPLEQVKRPYDVALSFAGEQREYARKVAEKLRKLELSVFFDEFEKETLWGTELVEYLGDIYGRQSEFVVLFCSREYVAKGWTTHERRFALARFIEGEKGRILPLMLDDIEVPGLPTTIAYLDGRTETPDRVAELLRGKLQRIRNRTRPA